AAPSAGNPEAPQEVRRLRPGSAALLQARRMSLTFPAKTVERLYIDGVKTFAYAEQEDADDDESNQHGEGDTDLDHKRHSFCTGGCQYKTVFQGHETDDLADGIPACHQ